MTFPIHISNIFRVIILLALASQTMYLLTPQLNSPDAIYIVLLKVTICFTCIISYVNDDGKMIRICAKGILIEEMDIDADSKRAKLTFIYVLIGIVYNPIIPLFESNTIWTVANVLTAIFIAYKIEKRKGS